jgi:hypothetical protein
MGKLMKDQDKERLSDYELSEDEDFDEHEFEIRTPGGRPINWRRIELIREKQWLKKQLDDYDSWGEDL